MANVFGFSTEPAGDFMPILKFDARAGRLFRVDRENTGDGFSNEPVDITSLVQGDRRFRKHRSRLDRFRRRQRARFQAGQDGRGAAAAAE